MAPFSLVTLVGVGGWEGEGAGVGGGEWVGGWVWMGVSVGV